MPLQFDDFPLIYIGCLVQSQVRGMLFSCATPDLAADLAIRLNRDYLAQTGGAPSWGLQPEGFERMLIVAAHEGDRQRREMLGL